MKRYIAWLLCLILLLQFAIPGVSAAPAQTETSGLEAFSQTLQQTYSLVKTPLADGTIMVELVMPTNATYVPGDLDGNERVNADDVVALLLHVSMPEAFPITIPADYNGDGLVTRDDVIQLLLHVSMPETFPLQ